MTAIEIARQAESYGDPVLFVENALERAKTWLSEALEHGDIDGIVELKSQAEAIRAYTTQKQLGHDAELSAAEIVRRAERGLGLAIRKGQEMGTVRPHGVTKYRPGQQFVDANLLSPAVIEPNPNVRTDAYFMAQEADDERFEEALAEAREERNLSRANVVRKIRREAPKPPAGRSEWHYNKRHLDPNRIVRTTVEMLVVMTGTVNGQVRCPGCHDMLPTDRRPGQTAWVPCRQCGRTVAATVQPLIRAAQAADAHLLQAAASFPHVAGAGQVTAGSVPARAPGSSPLPGGSLPHPWDCDGADWDPPAVFTPAQEDAIRSRFERRHGT